MWIPKRFRKVKIFFPVGCWVDCKATDVSKFARWLETRGFIIEETRERSGWWSVQVWDSNTSQYVYGNGEYFRTREGAILCGIDYALRAMAYGTERLNAMVELPF